MPDMQTALNKVLNSWNQSESNQMQTPTSDRTSHLAKFKPTNNVTRATFDYIKANPDTTSAEATKALVAKGFNSGSISSIITQLVAHGQVRRDAERKLFVAVGEYVPLKRHIKMPKGKRIPAPLKEVKEAKAPKQVAPPAPKQTDLLSTLNIKDARALYDELKKIFGG
jgi:hypothetical protein